MGHNATWGLGVLAKSTLLRGDRYRLVVVVIETGGRWSKEPLQCVESLAAAKVRDVPHAQSDSFISILMKLCLTVSHALLHSVVQAWRRWWS